ncbi:hypothetical protein OOT33_15515 [Sphingobium sp. DEHP117]|uniref:hypothetical protein n=1 Tax=Sphingobium sp. DEHP117 TaxID=2993436 RepID=UPI0027D531D7|nr:hypothetical protein [Sphingobium sp. DEHP117]MDQ4421829.1 hypothetical protein [Sphingobium sp. DEHP117]
MRIVKDYIEITDYTSLDALIDTLVSLRQTLGEDAGAELRLRGDDVFGRTLSISYMRPLTEEEAACEGRYAHLCEPIGNRLDLAA